MTTSEPSSSRPSIQQTRQLYLVCLVEMGAGFFYRKGYPISGKVYTLFFVLGDIKQVVVFGGTYQKQA